MHKVSQHSFQAFKGKFTSLTQKIFSKAFSKDKKKDSVAASWAGC